MSKIEKELSAIAAEHLDNIAHLGSRYDSQNLYLGPGIVVTVVLTFSGGNLLVSYSVFDAQSDKFKKIGAYDEKLEHKLKYIQQHGIRRRK